EGVFAQHVAPKLSLGARVGAGLDLAYGSYSVSFLGNTTSHSNWNAGVAFELAGGLWFDVGSIQLGGELALPIGYHSHKAENTMDIAFDYTSYDFDLLFNVRLRQH
ncbi:MAG TPA: hypothetical protein VFJ20_07795, partial [Gemmatimonadaceae bacterium]|nr:hypothetical protein [Gemmatimonadaceae bacterium]